ncbi:ribonuclease Z [Candidatus Similichlamydia laticola]|uniref:Ribonuclease Z n=1 Tax=Candidatus Similichlamydia laticola TaxID=2170265 RepID=A0A369KFU5_9BACT|nr:ribonuclease Z [Candidatus Similichlamydia laticola]RDB31575.1 Ribonuclease Z [Candidatus Similichlamydia laticola]
MSVRDLTIFGCSSQQPTRFRSHPGYLLRWNEEGFLLDPGEGTQRQFIFANIAPTTTTKILISHFHGDHCLGLGSMLMRLNLDQVKHTVHCYFPASGQRYFNRLRFGTSYHERIKVVPHPIIEGDVVEDGDFILEAFPLVHAIETLGWRITEKEKRRFDRALLEHHAIRGPAVRELITKGCVETSQGMVCLDQVSTMQKGDVFAYVTDTLPCEQALCTAQGAQLFLCESTYLESERHLATQNLHMTAKDAASIAKQAGVRQLVLTHFSGRYPDTFPFLEEAREIFPNTLLAEDLKTIPFERSSKK